MSIPFRKRSLRKADPHQTGGSHDHFKELEKWESPIGPTLILNGLPEGAEASEAYINNRGLEVLSDVGYKKLVQMYLIILLYAIASLIWGSTWFGIKLQLTQVPPILSIAYRFCLSSSFS